MTKRLILLLIMIALVLAGLLFVIGRGNAQERSAQDIYQRLKERGVPVIAVQTTSRQPLAIQIDLRSKSSSSKDERLSVEDDWNILLAHREATLAYRLGLPISMYRVNVYNAQDENLYSTDIYLYPEDLSQQIQPGNDSVDEKTAEHIVREALPFGGLTVKQFDLFSENKDLASNDRILIIEAVGKDLATINSSVPRLMRSISRFNGNGNREAGTNIALLHLRVVDESGTVYLDYMLDFEAGHSTWTMLEGVSNDWFPHPEVPAPTFTPGPPIAYPVESVPPEPSPAQAEETAYP